jgi:hypothetical protein
MTVARLLHDRDILPRRQAHRARSYPRAVPDRTDKFIDPRLLEEVDLGDGRRVTVRRGAIGAVLAGEGTSVASVFGGTHEHASYLTRELEICCVSVERGTDAIFVGEWFIGWLFTRQIAESAIRVAWVAKGVDAPDVEKRIRRLEKRDWKLLLQADKAIEDEVGRGILANRDDVLTFGSGMAKKEAPPEIRRLAAQAGEKGVFEIWRWASVIVHPGFGNYLQDVKIYQGRQVQRALHYSFATLTYAAMLALSQLAPDVELPDITGTRATLRGGGLIAFGDQKASDDGEDV